MKFVGQQSIPRVSGKIFVSSLSWNEGTGVECTITGTGLKKCKPKEEPMRFQSNSGGNHDLPTTRSANFLPCSELADTPSGTVAAAIFVMLIDDVFEAIMQSGFTASERDLNNDCLSCIFSEAACEGYQDDSIHGP